MCKNQEQSVKTQIEEKEKTRKRQQQKTVPTEGRDLEKKGKSLKVVKIGADGPMSLSSGAIRRVAASEKSPTNWVDMDGDLLE